MMRTITSFRSPLPALVILAASLYVTSATRLTAACLGELRTACELSGFERCTSHEEMLVYLRRLRAGSTDVRLGFYGKSRQGRKLPYVVLARPWVSQPAEAMALGRPVVVLAANIHGDEVTLREALLILMRDLAAPESEQNKLLEHMVIIVAPQLNPDGFQAAPKRYKYADRDFSAGPGHGNASGVNLNRDFMELQQPETAGFVAHIINRWHPHLVIDGHNGGRYPYNFMYLGPSHAACDPRIAQLCDEEIFPRIDRRMEQNGYRSFYYSRGTEQHWTIGRHEPRIGRNYFGMRDAISILFESPGRQSLETGVSSGIVAFEAVLEYVRDHPEQVLATVRQARLETLRKGQLADGDVVIDMRYEAEDWTVTYEIEVDQGDARGGLRTITDAPILKKPVPTAVRAQPYAYLLPEEAEPAVALLRRHGITVQVLQEAVNLEVGAYPLIDTRQFRGSGQQGAIRAVGEPVTISRVFPAGTYVVATGQMAGRVVTQLLEPETADSLVHGNTGDAWLARAERLAAPAAGDEGQERAPVLLPIWKVMQPRALPSIIAE